MSDECAFCGASFATPAELLAHRNRAHPDATPEVSFHLNPESERAGFVCGLCGSRFATPQALAQHNLRPHPPRSRSRPIEPVPA